MKSIWLTYHDIFDKVPDQGFPFSATMYHLPKDKFIAQLGIIKKSKTKVISVNEFVTRSQNEDSIVLTFDDGWQGLYEFGVDLLQRFCLPATLFVTRDFIGRHGFIGKIDLTELIACGVDIGIHGTTHRMLSRCTVDEIIWEFSACKDYLESLANKPVNIASIPGGFLNNTVIEGAKKAGIKALCTSIPGINSGYTSVFSYKRLSIRQNTNLQDMSRYCNYKIKPEIIRWFSLEAIRRTLGSKNYVLFRRWLMKDSNKNGKLIIFDP